MTAEDLKKKLTEPEGSQSPMEQIMDEIQLKDKDTVEDEEESKRERLRIEVLNEIIVSVLSLSTIAMEIDIREVLRARSRDHFECIFKSPEISATIIQ